ncbi:MAG TPA: Ig-like domain-containing protein, partial [Candidatus Udaeobacter sp.]|nr:Ig-like domain-containing protein [Candidatus Udaeobacter sp.]
AATRAPVGTDVAITFSEPMDRASVLDWILISPPRDFGERSWKGNTFRLSGGDDFAPNTTFTVVVGVGCRGDRERVPMDSPHLFVFSTGDSLDAGAITGRLLAHGAPAHGVMVWALDRELAAARSDTLVPDYVTQVGADSTFTFLGLKPGRSYLVLAHGDLNRDREFDRDLDFLALDPTPIWLDPAHPSASGVQIDFRNSRARGAIAGAVRDSAAAAAFAAGDTSETMVMPDSALAPGAVRDTTRAIEVRAELIGVVQDSLSARWMVDPDAELAAITDSLAVRATADSLGKYELRNLKAGFYRVSAFLDRNRNRSYDALEPAAGPVDSVLVISGERTSGIDLILPRSAAESSPEGSRAPDRPRGP